MYHRKRKHDYITVEEIAEIAHLHRSTIEKYITLLLTINNSYPFVCNPELSEQTIRKILKITGSQSAKQG